MLIVARFPLADNRLFLEDPSLPTHSLPFPSWPIPRADREIKDKIKELHEAFTEMSKHLPEDKDQEAARDLETLSREAISPEPRKKWYQLSADGLIEAAKTVGAIAAPVITTVEAIVSILSG